MDFKNVRCGMAQTGDGMRAIQNALFECGDLWKDMPKWGYGTGELIIHIVEVGRFTQLFVNDQLGLEVGGERFQLPDNLRSAVHNLSELRRVNLASARAKLGVLSNAHAFRHWVRSECDHIYVWTKQLPDNVAHQRVSHPLVEMECGAATMLYRQLVDHAHYHIGQITQQMKQSGFGDKVPHLPIFGKIHAAPAPTT